MEKELLSVIIPIYNAGEYVEQCLETVLSQTYQNLELILLDDGSTDNSLEICKAYKHDIRVHIFCQENQGVVAARKNAIIHAHGTRVVFIDSDDYIDSDFLEKLMNESCGMDLVTSGYFKSADVSMPVFDRFQPGSYSSQEQLNFIIDNMEWYCAKTQGGITPFIWNKLFRTDLAKQIFQEVNLKVFIGEDTEFLYRYILKCGSIKISNICGYYYRNRENSIITSCHENYLLNVHELYLSLKELFECHPRKVQLIQQLQIRTAAALRFAPYIMGFSRLAISDCRYMFPFYEEMAGKSILIYGAGKIGKEYYMQLRHREDISIVGWTDKKAELYQKDGYPVVPVSACVQKKYDYLVISVKLQEVAKQIEEELKMMNVPKQKIIWKPPIHLQF